MNEIIKEKLIELRELKRRKRELEAELKQTNIYIDQLSRELYDIFEENELEKITLDGTTFYPQERVYVNCKKDDVEKLKEWASENAPDLLDLFHETINSQSLTSWYRKQLEENPEIELPEFINISPKTTMGVRNL